MSENSLPSRSSPPDPGALAQRDGAAVDGSLPSPASAADLAGSLSPASAHGVGHGLAALVAANLVPLVGVAFLGWKVFPIVLLYWIENIVVGCFTIAKMGVARGTTIPEGRSGLEVNGREVDLTAGRLSLIGFFCVHYGMFTLVHGVFVFVLFSGWAVPTPGGPGLRGIDDAWWLVAAVAALVVSHAVSYARVFIGEGEYLVRSPAQLMTEPYGRIVVLHVTIIFGGWIVNAMGAPVGALVVLVALKTGLDVRGYRRQHRVPAPS